MRQARMHDPAIRLSPTFDLEKMKMKRNILLTLLGLALLFGNAGVASAEVKRVQMHIAGYLCGN